MKVYLTAKEWQETEKKIKQRLKTQNGFVSLSSSFSTPVFLSSCSLFYKISWRQRDKAFVSRWATNLSSYPFAETELSALRLMFLTCMSFCFFLYFSLVSWMCSETETRKDKADRQLKVMLYDSRETWQPASKPVYLIVPEVLFYDQTLLVSWFSTLFCVHQCFTEV